MATDDSEEQRKLVATVDVNTTIPLQKPILGPFNPNRTAVEVLVARNTPTGRVEPVHMDGRDFEAQRRTFNRLGAARDPKNLEDFIGDKRIAAQRNAGVSPDKNTILTKPARGKRERLADGDPADIDGFLGPWAGYKDELNVSLGPTEEELSAFLHAKAQSAPQTRLETIELGQEKSTFHGRTELDYMGRTYMHAPQDLDVSLEKDPGSFECFAPKKLVHTWNGHTKGVNAIRFLPRSGHLLLSCSQDTRIKLWEVYGERQCLRTFLGHNKPVRDVCFDTTGKHFASCAYDKTVKYWDTETGKCVRAIENMAIAYCVKVHPDEDKSHIVLAGMSDNRVLQWDMRTGQVVQEYSQHIEGVNSITFFDNNKRFVTSSDDKTLRLWDYDIPVTVKYIADPSMHSMPTAALHPHEPFIVFQSLNNRMLVYSVQDRLQIRHKKFVGHSTAGFAIQMDFSPDGKYVVSGDGRGQLLVWDWKSGQIARRIEAHSEVCISAQWNPQQPSRVATCSWDGTIKYWD